MPTTTSSMSPPLAVDDGIDLPTFYRQYFVPLARLAAMVVGEHAPDVVQDVFLAVHRRSYRFASWEPTRLLAYVRRAVLNGAYSHQRHARVVAAHDAQYRPDPPAPGADDTAFERINGERLRAAVAQLPRRQREVILLRYLLDASIADTAQALGVSASAVTTSTQRALAALQQTWGDPDDDTV